MCDHNMVVIGSLWPLWDRFGWYIDCFNYSSCSCSCMLCPAMWIILIQQSELFWNEFEHGFVLSIGLQWKCSTNAYLTFPSPRFRATYAKKNVLIPMCKINPKFEWQSNGTYPKHLPLEFLAGHVLAGVIHVQGAHLWHHCLKLQSFPKKSQHNGFKICELIWVGILTSFKRGTICHVEMVWVELWSRNRSRCKLTIVAFKNSIDIPILISFIA